MSQYVCCFCIRNRTSERSERVRFLIRQQLVRKYRTPALSMKYSLFPYKDYVKNLSIPKAHLESHNIKIYLPFTYFSGSLISPKKSEFCLHPNFVSTETP